MRSLLHNKIWRTTVRYNRTETCKDWLPRWNVPNCYGSSWVITTLQQF